jgi:hypothetical protein
MYSCYFFSLSVVAPSKVERLPNPDEAMLDLPNGLIPYFAVPVLPIETRPDVKPVLFDGPFLLRAGLKLHYSISLSIAYYFMLAIFCCFDSDL